MKKLWLIPILIFAVFITGCSNRANIDSQRDTNSEVFEAIIQGNEKYGNKKEDTCKSVFKCNVSQINEKVIMAPTWEPEIFKDHVDSINKISGPTGHGFTVYELSKNDKKITYITSGIGACNIMDAVLALGTTNCKEIIFIGANGALKEDIKIGDVMIPEYSICGVGADRYLCTGNLGNNDCFGRKYYPDSELFNKAIEISKSVINGTNMQVHIAQNFSIDTIYAEYAHLDEIITMGCNSIEMETATFFHAANVAGIKAVAIFDVSDNTLAAKSLYNGRTQEDSDLRKKAKQEIVPQITLKIFNIE